MTINLTVDLESTASQDGDRKYLDALEPLLSEMKRLNSRATFFVVGELVEECSDFLRNAVSAGHEVALHGYTHRFLTSVGPDDFRAEVRRGRAEMEDLVGVRPLGYRAPYFSLTRQTIWATEILAEEGFVYSSSVLPCWNPQVGFPSAPRQPFRWQSGLLEMPVPTFGIGNLRAPLLGGAYLRLSPAPLMWLAMRGVRRKEGVWTYCHPYDFDTAEQFTTQEHLGWVMSQLLFRRRRLMLDRTLKLLADGSNTMSETIERIVFPTWLVPN